MKDYEHLDITVNSNGVALVQMDRPPANAVNRAMYMELADLFSDPDQMGSGLQTIILAGKGRHFCAGNDLDEFATMSPENGKERMWRVREAFFAIQDCPVPVIAAVQGAALGTGLAIAASCDLIVAEKDATFGLPELTVGVMGGARHLARLVPQAVVRRMFLTGQPVTADQLAGYTGGLVLCDDGELHSTASEIAERIAGYSPTAIRISKHVLNQIETMDIKAGYTFEQGYTVQMSGHPDSKEALEAFREKRTPRYLPLATSNITG